MHSERSCAVDRRPFSFCGCFRYSDVFVGPAVVKEPVAALSHHTLNEYNVWHLPDLFPFFLGGEDGRVGAREQLSRVVAVEDGDGSAIDEMVVGAIVNEHDTA